MTTRGDQILDRTLSQVGGKGLFVKELEVALQEGRCDLAVHSMKDVPMTLTREFALVAILAREDPRDALVSPRYTRLAQLPVGAHVGTSSLRRAAQLLALQPELRLESLRGNLDTRLAKLDAGQYDAIILAAAGLKRLELEARISGYIEPEECLPAPGQGALGIEVLAARDDLKTMLAALNDPASAACVRAERAVSRGLGGNCSVPLAAYATSDAAGALDLRALVSNESGTRIVRCQRSGVAGAPEALGAEVAADLVAQGALELIGTR